MLSLKNIIKTYTMGGEDVPVLKGVSLEIQDGEFIAIMGPSWSGKSTLMNIIGLLDTPSTGEYILDGVPVEKLTGNEQSAFRGRKVGFIFQWYNLIPRLSALEQVSLPLSYQWISGSERTNRAIEALKRVWLGDKIYNKPNELSGWQQQRVAIARAIVANPSVILADEPTWALDSKTGVEIMQILSELHAEWKTILLITHDANIAKYAKRTIRIKDGLIDTDN